MQSVITQAQWLLENLPGRSDFWQVIIGSRAQLSALTCMFLKRRDRGLLGQMSKMMSLRFYKNRPTCVKFLEIQIKLEVSTFSNNFSQTIKQTSQIIPHLTYFCKNTLFSLHVHKLIITINKFKSSIVCT